MHPQDDHGEDAHLLTLDEAADRAMMSRRTIERKIAAGAIPVARAGGRGGRMTTQVWSDDIDLYWAKQRSNGITEARKRRTRTA